MYNIGLVYSDLSSLRILGRVKYVSNPITVMDDLRDPVTEIIFFIYERYHLPERCTLGENFVKAPFSSKVADQAEIVRVKGSEKQAIVSCNGSEK